MVVWIEDWWKTSGVVIPCRESRKIIELAIIDNQDTFSQGLCTIKEDLHLG